MFVAQKDRKRLFSLMVAYSTSIIIYLFFKWPDSEAILTIKESMNTPRCHEESLISKQKDLTILIMFLWFTAHNIYYIIDEQIVNN